MKENSLKDKNIDSMDICIALARADALRAVLDRDTLLREGQMWDLDSSEKDNRTDLNA